MTLETINTYRNRQEEILEEIDQMHQSSNWTEEMGKHIEKLDNKFRPYHNGELMSQYFYNNSKVCSNNVTKDYKWFEIVHYNSPNLIVEYHWILNEQKYSCILEFIKT